MPATSISLVYKTSFVYTYVANTYINRQKNSVIINTHIFYLCSCVHIHLYTGGIVPFSNPTGMLIFVKDSVQMINLSLINDNTLEVRM